MRQTLLLLFFLCMSCVCDAADIKFGGGIRAGLFSYNEDRLDTTKISWGGQGRVLYGSYIGGEFSFQRREDSIVRSFGSIDIETWPVQASALVYPFGHRIVSPFFIAGLGWYSLNIDVNITRPIQLTQSFHLRESSPHLGAGIETFISDHFSAGFDVRKLFFAFETPFGTFTAEELKYAYLVNITANFYF